METAHHASSGHSALPKVGWLWNETWRIYGKYFAYFIAVTVPVIALSTFSGAFGNMADFAAPNVVAGITFSFLAVIAALCGFVVSLIVPIALVRAANESRTGTPSTMEELYSYSGKHFWGYIWIVLLSAFFNFTAMGAFIIPGIIVNVYLSLALMAYVVDGRRGIDALVWSAHAICKNWWKVLWRVCVLVLTIMASMIALFLIVFPLQGLMPIVAWYTLFDGLSVFLNNLFIVPFAIIYSVLLYTELKKTKHAPTDLDQYRIRRNLWTMAGVGIVVGIALFVVGVRFVVPVIVDEMRQAFPGSLMYSSGRNFK